MSAILVKMPPAMRRTDAPRDSPIAKPMKQAPAMSWGRKSRMMSIISSSMLMRTMPIDMPDFMGMRCISRGLPSRDAKATREFAKVLTRIPYHATAYEPPMPTRLNAMTIATRPHVKSARKP